ncbi:MAG: Hpt domain-containing protein, partial [Pseudomonadota bacterium]
MRGQDLLTALADELQGLAPELASAYDSGSSGETAVVAQANHSYVTSVARLSEAAGYMGLGGVQRIAASVLSNLEHLSADDQDARVLVRPFFTEWAQLLESHLRNASAAGPVESLIAHFGGGWVPLPLDDGALQELRAELSAASGIGAALDETEQAAPEALEAADLVLEVSPDVDGALIDAFLHDSPPQAAEVTQSLQGWIADPTHTELLRNAKRAAHTLKGSANILGIRGVAKLAHRLEDILEICEAESTPPSSLRAQALMSAADCLEQMIAAVAGEDQAPENAMSVVEILDAARNNDASDTVRQRSLEAPAVPTEFAPQAVASAASVRAAPVATTRVPTQLLDNL